VVTEKQENKLCHNVETTIDEYITDLHHCHCHRCCRTQSHHLLHHCYFHPVSLSW